jgi:hypothetical protein
MTPIHTATHSPEKHKALLSLCTDRMLSVWWENWFLDSIHCKGVSGYLLYLFLIERVECQSLNEIETFKFSSQKILLGKYQLAFSVIFLQ